MRGWKKSFFQFLIFADLRILSYFGIDFIGRGSGNNGSLSPSPEKEKKKL
jgi:hypothetical protein